jgi:hypothetical protein
MKRKTTMKISIDTSNLDQFKFLLNTLLLGRVTSLLQKKANIDDIEYLMFGPKSIELLKLIPIESIYSDIIHQGTEIEDIASLFPDKLDDYLESIQKTILNNYQSISLSKQDPINITLLFDKTEYLVK